VLTLLGIIVDTSTFQILKFNDCKPDPRPLHVPCSLLLSPHRRTPKLRVRPGSISFIYYRCVTKQTELPKYKNICECYEKTPFQKMYFFVFAISFVLKVLLRKVPGSQHMAYTIACWGDPIQKILTLSEPPQNIHKTLRKKMIMEFMDDVKSYEKRSVNMVKVF
jgi:hypothetical protein